MQILRETINISHGWHGRLWKTRCRCPLYTQTSKALENTLLRNLAKQPLLASEHLMWDLTVTIDKVHDLRQVT